MDNRVNFRLTEPSILESIASEAKRRNININEYCRQMAILGHTSLQGSNAKTEAVTKTSIVLLTTLRRYIESDVGKDTAADILLKGRDDAEAILNTLGIEL